MNKKWYTQVPFLKDIYRQGGIDSFALAQKDILETMRDDLDAQAEELSKTKLASLLSVVDPKKIVTLDKQRGIVFIGGERVDEGRLANLKSEAEFLSESELWQLIYQTTKELAQKAMFVSGEGLDDLKKGRSILFTLESQRNVVELFKGYQKK